MKHNNKNFGRMSIPGKTSFDLLMEKWDMIEEEENRGIKIPRSHVITQFLLKILWVFADDITYSFNELRDVYSNVPEHLRNISVEQTYVYTYPRKYRKEINEWLGIEK